MGISDTRMKNKNDKTQFSLDRHAQFILDWEKTILSSYRHAQFIFDKKQFTIDKKKT